MFKCVDYIYIYALCIDMPVDPYLYFFHMHPFPIYFLWLCLIATGPLQR